MLACHREVSARGIDLNATLVVDRCSRQIRSHDHMEPITAGAALGVARDHLENFDGLVVRLSVAVKAMVEIDADIWVIIGEGKTDAITNSADKCLGAVSVT
jgi:hypothetical protein